MHTEHIEYIHTLELKKNDTNVM